MPNTGLAISSRVLILNEFLVMFWVLFMLSITYRKDTSQGTALWTLVIVAH